MRILFVFFLLTTLVGKAQQPQDSLWGGKNVRFGGTVQIGVSHWKQNNFNSLLLQNNLPTARALNTASNFGDILQWNKLRLTGVAEMWQNKHSVNNQNFEQKFAGGSLNAEYFIIRKKRFSLSPSIGAGMLNGIVKVRQNATEQSFANALTNRSSIEIFNRQGYINAAINVGFCYIPKLKDHLFQAAVGYNLGFANTNWSTDLKNETLTGSTSDVIRQAYVLLKMNFLFLDLNKKNHKVMGK